MTSKHPQRCEHECVCMGYCNRAEMVDDAPCRKSGCVYDTRQQEREGK